MRVLFVDDEEYILEGIERMLFHAADSWEISCAGSGKEALEILAEDPFDVIVTDMRMPGMDGAALLHEVHTNFPSLVRIVLSGYAELEAAMRAVPVAHQFLTKPCKAETLCAVIERAFSLQALLTDDRVRKIVGHVNNLPSVPQVYSKLTRALAEPEVEAADIADIISQDAAMCAKILQLVNSSFFGRGTKVSSVKQAVVRLGFQMVKNLALSAEVFKVVASDKTLLGFSIEAEQVHALRCATLAKTLLSEDRAAAEDAFMAGMLHDIGKLLMAAELPDKLGEALKLAHTKQISLEQAEVELMGISHAEIGAYLLGIWGLPYPIVEAVANHHNPLRVQHRSGLNVVDAVYIANCLCRGHEPDSEVLATLNIDNQLDQWRAMAAAQEAA